MHVLKFLEVYLWFFILKVTLIYTNLVLWSSFWNYAWLELGMYKFITYIIWLIFNSDKKCFSWNKMLFPFDKYHVSFSFEMIHNITNLYFLIVKFPHSRIFLPLHFTKWCIQSQNLMDFMNFKYSDIYLFIYF